jgi:hypothetical protein
LAVFLCALQPLCGLGKSGSCGQKKGSPHTIARCSPAPPLAANPSPHPPHPVCANSPCCHNTPSMAHVQQKKEPIKARRARCCWDADCCAACLCMEGDEGVPLMSAASVRTTRLSTSPGAHAAPSVRAAPLAVRLGARIHLACLSSPCTLSRSQPLSFSYAYWYHLEECHPHEREENQDGHSKEIKDNGKMVNASTNFNSN